MGLTQDFEQTIVDRMQCDAVSAQALFDEALTLMFTGEPEAARLILRDLTHSTLGSERWLSESAGRPRACAARFSRRAARA